MVGSGDGEDEWWWAVVTVRMNDGGQWWGWMMVGSGDGEDEWWWAVVMVRMNDGGRWWWWRWVMVDSGDGEGVELRIVTIIIMIIRIIIISTKIIIIFIGAPSRFFWPNLQRVFTGFPQSLKILQSSWILKKKSKFGKSLNISWSSLKWYKKSFSAVWSGFFVCSTCRHSPSNKMRCKGCLITWDFGDT